VEPKTPNFSLGCVIRRMGVIENMDSRV
jgi:hypothetical protein